ncbi:MAG: glycoside hydrolase family 13 protein [Pseudanabaenales cyanobacterium]|nr:glycoside hydrolase family 13 protein [Pseudanabaenales cyanobacterium]
MEIQTPDWVKHAVFYQIFPDRFAKTTQPRQQPKMAVPLELWESPPTYNGYKGGDLWGVMEQLDYLQDLGITAIYFTPIFQSASNHRYHTHDYYQVDPLLGGNEAFFDLLNAAHQRGIKIVLDGVFNHASRGFFFFNDILENGPHSPWLDWFKIEDWPLSAYDGSLPANYLGWAGNRALPQFNHDNPAVREYIMQIAEHWIRVGIDGWRLDVPFEIKAAGFWREFRDRVKAINPEAYIVGEIWSDARQWLNGDQFDGVMNYMFTGPTLAFTAGDHVRMDYVESPEYYPYPPLDAAAYAQKIQHLLGLYPWGIQLTQLNLLSSHDIARVVSVVSEDQASFELATLLQMTFPGPPSIYYGDEVGLPGGPDPDCRRSFPAKDQWNHTLFKLHRDLIALRHAHSALRTGDYTVLATQDKVYVFARTLPEEELIIAVNAGEKSATVMCSPNPSFFRSQPIKPIFGLGEIAWNDQNGSPTLSLTLPPRSGLIVGP